MAHYRWFTYWKWWFSKALLNNQMVTHDAKLRSDQCRSWHATSPSTKRLGRGRASLRCARCQPAFPIDLDDHLPWSESPPAMKRYEDSSKQCCSAGPKMAYLEKSFEDVERSKCSATINSIRWLYIPLYQYYITTTCLVVPSFLVRNV